LPIPEESPAPTEEQRALEHIAALIKRYEPEFDLQQCFTTGVFGCSDPEYPAIRRKWIDDLDRKGLTFVAKGLMKEVADDLRDDTELSCAGTQASR
jgi:hypothetical protein